MDRYLPTELRLLVAQRADYLCEYCLIHEEDTFVGCQVDHIISLKHGGNTEAANLAYACACCNRNKGSDIGSIIWRTGEFIRFFNPRTDRWADHFYLEGTLIQPRSDIGEATARILWFNTSARVLERATFIIVGAYPSLPALTRIRR
jgi:hypothetical protein